MELTSPGPHVPCVPGAVLGAAATCCLLARHQHPLLSGCGGGSGCRTWWVRPGPHRLLSAGGFSLCLCWEEPGQVCRGLPSRTQSWWWTGRGSWELGGWGSGGKPSGNGKSGPPPSSTRSGKGPVPFAEQGPAWPRPRGPHPGDWGFSGPGPFPGRRGKQRRWASCCTLTGPLCSSVCGLDPGEPLSQGGSRPPGAPASLTPPPGSRAGLGDQEGAVEVMEGLLSTGQRGHFALEGARGLWRGLQPLAEPVAPWVAGPTATRIVRRPRGWNRPAGLPPTRCPRRWASRPCCSFPLPVSGPLALTADTEVPSANLAPPWNMLERAPGVEPGPPGAEQPWFRALLSCGCSRPQPPGLP